jgi:glycosyltransferase involved in cell wall biosynthesis
LKLLERHALSKMHITFITNNYPPTVCGIGDHTDYLTKALVKRGYTISVICNENSSETGIESRAIYPIVKNWDKEGYQVVLGKLDHLRPDWVFLQYEPYTFHAKGLPFKCLSFVKALKNQNYKTLIFFHEIAVKWSWSLKLIPISIGQRIIAHLLLLYATKGVTSMAFYKKMFLKNLQYKVALQPVGSNIFQDIKKNSFNKEIKRDNNNAFWIACFGSDGAEKGYTILLEAIKKLPFVHVLFIGKGTHIKQYALENDLQDRIHVTGVQNTEGVYHSLQPCDVFAMVHADIRGGIGFKSGSLAAGFNAGLPIVGYQGSITEPDKLIHGKNCWLIKEATPSAFEKAIIHLYTNEELRQQLSLGSCQFFANHLHWDILAKDYDTLLAHKKAKALEIV